MWYVYVDWTTEECPRPYYIGKGDSRRLHVKFRNRLHENIKRKYGLDRRVAFELEHEDVAFAIEQDLIRSYKTYVHGEGYVFGANFTVGGEGASGHQHTDDARRRISENHARRHGCSEETRQAIGHAHRGKIVGDNTRQAISDGTKTWWTNLTEEQRQSYRDKRNKNRPQDLDETRRKRSESLKRYFAQRRGEV